ncbi:MAG: Gfo/Idh/MocA family protein [Planctomycetaceae bacterium]
MTNRPIEADVPRRDFLQTAGAAATAGLFAGLSTETARGYAANDTLSVACIGTGGRCQMLMKSLREIPNVRITAVCDIYEPSLEAGAKLADPQATRFKEFRQVLDRQDIDAVLIGAPDHWHVPMTVAACQAGKDVYVEKPLTHDLKEGAAVIAAQNNHKRVVQVGTQQRSMPHIQKAYEIVKSGELGRIFKVHLTWNRNQPRYKQQVNVDQNQLNWKAFLGNAPDQPFDAYRYRNWRWFWDFGGGILTDLMVHWIDVGHWFLAADHPTEAVAIGNHFQMGGLWETPDSIQCLLKYPNDVQVYFEGNFSNARHGGMIEFMAENATLYLDRGRYEVIPERNKKIQPQELILSTNPTFRGADFYDIPDGEMVHLVNWVECVRTRAKPAAPAEAGVSAAGAAQLGNIAFRQHKVAEWSREAG